MTSIEEFVVKMRQLIDTERQAEIEETKCVMRNIVLILFVRSLLASDVAVSCNDLYCVKSPSSDVSTFNM